jgi:hypothetical protein
MIMIERVGKLVSKLNVNVGDLKSDWTGRRKPEPDSDLESEEITVRSIFSSRGIALPIRIRLRHVWLKDVTREPPY